MKEETRDTFEETNKAIVISTSKPIYPTDHMTNNEAISTSAKSSSETYSGATSKPISYLAAAEKRFISFS